MTPTRQFVGLVLLMALTFAAAGLGSLATALNFDWYATQVEKPAWTPPGWIFVPAWAVLFVGMSVAAWLVWRKGGVEASRPALGLYLGQLALGAVWFWMFFGLHRPGWAFGEILVLLVAVAATTDAFWQDSAAAGALMLPYLAWLSFAATLNWSIWRLNG